VKQKNGRVEEANGGTIFLDEIADMSRPLQAKLLRFLEDGTFTRIGGTQELRVNVRLVAATNRDIVAAIATDQFREDLFHRLNVVQFRLPPLRDREGDIPLLADHFLKMFNASMNKGVKRISRGALQKLAAHRWPGNVRELRNVIERALILETTDEVQALNLPDFQLETRLNKTTPSSPVATGERAIDQLVADFERDLINATLEHNGFNLTKSADKLKISRHALRYRMQRLNLTATDDDLGAETAKVEPEK
jgi:DNA-binding NtrC family response regulator